MNKNKSIKFQIKETKKNPKNHIIKSKLKEIFIKGIYHNKYVFKNLTDRAKSYNIIRKMIIKFLVIKICQNPSIY